MCISHHTPLPTHFVLKLAILLFVLSFNTHSKIQKKKKKRKKTNFFEIFDSLY